MTTTPRPHFDGPLSQDNLSEMMKHPDYWKDQDPDYCAEVEAGFKLLYPGKAGSDSSAPAPDAAPAAVYVDGFDGPVTHDKLREMMQDARYWKEHEKAYCDLIEAGFKALYPGKARS